MNASATVETSSTRAASPSAFWERTWLTGGILFVVLFLITALIYGNQPPVGASRDALAAFYTGARIRILIAAACSGANLLNLMWFAAALRTVLAQERQDGWGAAATASSAAFGSLYFLLAAMSGALAFSIAGSGNQALVSGVNDVSWALVVLSSFPRAMLVMSSAFGLWRAGLISNSLFQLGVAVVVMGVLGGTTWFSSGFWAPDGAYSRFIWPAASLAWILIVSRVLLARGPSTRTEW